MQTSRSPSKIQCSFLVLVGLLLAALPAAAGEYRVLIDADADATTGCSVTIAGSTFDGAEQIVITTVDDATDQVTAVARQECTDPGTDTFGAPVALSDFPTPWPVGVALGTMGSDVVETYFPLSALGGDPVSMRLGYASDDLLGNQDVMFNSTGGSGGDPIVLSLGHAPLEIPTVGPVGLVFLSLLLAGAAAWVLRDADRFAGGGTVAAVLLMVILAPVALAVADILLDGDPSDWVGGIDAQGTDPAGDVPGSADILAGYAAVSTDGTILYLRFDVTREAQPEAVGDAFTVTEDDPQTILDVLANDTDLDGGLKEVVAVTQPAGGTVAITGGGADVGYTPDADFCNDGTPTDDFTYTVNGGSSATVSVTVTCVNDAPVKTAGGGGPATFVEGGGPVVLDPGVTVSDVDDVNLESATVSITNLLDGADEVLAADTTGTAIVAVYNSATGVLSLTGSDTVANYQQVLRTVTYDNLSADPNPIDRGLTCVANDGDVDSNTLNVSVTVGAVNTAPTKTAGGGGPVSFTEDGGPVAIDPGVTVSDPDDVNLESATITLTNPLDGAAEVLAASTGGTGITASYDSGTGILSLTGTETLAVYEMVLQSITYDNSSDDPSLTDRSIDCLVNDGTDDSNTLTATVEITAVNDAPTITAIADQTIDEDTSTGALGFTIDDPDHAVGSLTVGASSSNTTLIPDANLVIGGTAPNLTIEATPAANENGGPVTITVSVDDGVAPPTTTTFDITVNPVNDAPTITAIADQTIDEDTSTGALGFTIDDVDDPVGSLVVSATSSDQTLIPDANLVIGGTAPNLTIEATPAADQNGGPATITVSVDDGVAPPTTTTFDVTVNPVNDPPAVTSPISYSAIGNTLLRVLDATGDGHDTALPGRVASTADGTNALAKANPTDIDSAGTPSFVAGTYATTAAPGDGSLTIDDDGDFYYTPPTGFTGGTDTVAVDVTDGDGGFTPVTFELTVTDMIWYVEDTTGAKNPAGSTDGRSTDAFETLAAAEAASGAGHIILVMETDGPLDEGITLKSGQKLYGEPVPGSLLPAALILETGNASPARPQIHRSLTTGPAVTVDATSADRTGVEIRHLDLSSDNDNAVDATSGGTSAVGLVISDNFVTGSGAEGFDLNPASSGLFTATIETNVFATASPTGNAIDVTTTGAAGDVHVAINQNTDVTSDATAIHLDGTLGTGTFFITGFAANTVHGNTGGSGVVVRNAVFDADPSDGDFDEVAAGIWDVGASGNPVGAAGMSLGTSAQPVSGNLAFDDLDVFAAAGAGVSAAGSAVFAIGPPDSGLRLEIGDGTIEATGGPGLDLDPLTSAITLTSVTSSGSSGAGISITSSAGSVTVTDGNALTKNDVDVDNATGHGIEITSSLAGSLFSFSSIDIDGTGGDGVHLDGARTVTLPEGTIDGTTGDGVRSVDTSVFVGSPSPTTVTFGATSPISGDAVEVVNTDAVDRSATIHSNVLGAAAGQVGGRGLFLNSTGSGTLTATVASNSSFATDHAIETADGGGASSLVVSLDSNAPLRSGTAGTPAVEMNGGALHSTLVTSLFGTTVTGSGPTGSGGMLLGRVTFDSDATPGNGFGAVAGGTTTVGQNAGSAAAGDRVAGDGVSFVCSTGSLSFGTLGVANSSGAGVEAMTKAGDCGGTATTFTLGSTGGTVDTTGGPALFLDPLTTALTLGTAISSGSPSTGALFDGVAGTAAISTLNVSTPGTEGVLVSSSTGTFTFGSTSGITGGAGGPAFRIEGGSASVDYDGTITQANAHPAVRVNAAGGVSSFDGAVDADTTTANAIDLTTNTGTFSFTGGLALDPTTGTGFRAVGGGTVNVTGTNDVGANTPLQKTAVEISGATIGTSGVTFREISVDQGSTGSDATAIILADTGAGTFDVLGDGTTALHGNGSGGTIQNLTDVDAITLDNTGGRVTLQNMIIQDIGDSGDGSDARQTRSFRDGIHGETVTGGLTLQSMTLRRFSDHAILGSLFSDGTSLTSWSGIELRDSLFEDSNRFHVSGRGDDLDEGMIRLRGLTGTMIVDNCTLRDGGRGLDVTTPEGTGTLDVTVQQSTFENLYKEFASGSPVNVGLRGVSFEARGAHDMVVRIGDPAESNSALGNTFTNNMTASVVIFGQEGGGSPHTGDIDAVISQNDFVVTDHSTAQLTPPSFVNFNFPQGGVSLNPAGSGTFEAIVSNNLFDEVMHAAGGFGQLTIGHNTGGGASEFIIRGNEFKEAWDMPFRLRAEGNGSMAVLVENNTWTEGLVGGPGTNFEGGDCGTGDPLGFCPTPFDGVHVNVRNGGSMDLTIRNEILPQHDDVNDGTFTFEAEVQNQAGNELRLYLDDNKAPDGYRLIRSAGTFDLYREIGSDTTPADIIDGNGNTGGNGTVAGGDVNGDNTDPPVVTADPGINPTDTPPVLPSITIP